ncbi:MAG: ATP-binding protein [Clostridia bacterium]|nr:ATP-binding protein [Clostridia bacterium]
MQDIYRRIQREYEESRSKALAEVDARKKELYEREPELAKIDEEIQKQGLEITKSVIFVDDDSKREEIIRELNSVMDRLKQKKAEIFAKMGIPEDYLKPSFSCSLCEDTGIVGSITGAKPCNCFRQKVINYTYNQAQIFNLERENFLTFDESVFSEEKKPAYNSDKSPRENIRMIREIAEKFVERFGEKETKSLMFTGGTGLGKTFLSNCVAKAVMDAGYTVLYQTAGLLMDLIMDYRKGDSERFDASQYEELFEVDLLIIDDLGTENVTEARRSELFNILNTRILKGKKILISTNRDLKELVNFYDQRIVSRILGNFQICRFFGSDLRLASK